MLSQYWNILLGYNILKNTNIQYHFQYHKEEFITTEGNNVETFIHRYTYEAFNMTYRHNFTWVATENRRMTEVNFGYHAFFETVMREESRMRTD